VCVVGRMRDLILQLSKSSIYSTKPLIFIRTGVRLIQGVVVLVLKCALAIAAVMAIYCLAVVLMERLSD
ncbi:hypothetical protein P2O75_16815, partial [Escherichia coli]